MTATSLNGKGSRWTVMGEHFKQVYLLTTIDVEKKYSVSQQCNVYNIHFYATKITEQYLFNLLFIWCVLSSETYKPGDSLFSLNKSV